ncbi:imidazole glycerol phosphate synthase subunit HisH [Citrobacter cronae]|uniref:imidazole glycerol phosphate synthase subunit HisH n=1 Tax=Citrobacter freundii complex TaxID=1344959 RepID=UPI0033398ECB|nr:imidazole glycerol phosphate synthase subunit HisH [Citrobacter werkmanii]
MIALVDYGLGNIKAFSNVYNKLNIEYVLASTPETLSTASHIILPGVGAFDHAMQMLNKSGLRDTLEELVLGKKIPVLGICVGMQMMARRSDEGNMEGLGWIAAEVRKFPDSCDDYPLPHMGWNNISLTGEYPLTKDLTDDKRFYFLHSYYMDCEDQSNILALASYSSEFSCIVQNNNIYGIQCHPEKSHKNGISILKNFSEV